MVESKSLLDLEIEARELLGDHASEWLVRPSRLLDGLTPAEVASTSAGRRVVLHELRRTAKPLRAVLVKNRVEADEPLNLRRGERTSVGADQIA